MTQSVVMPVHIEPYSLFNISDRAHDVLATLNQRRRMSLTLIQPRNKGMCPVG